MIVLYTTKTCTKCKIIKAKFTQKNIDYTEINDPSILMAKGFMSAPILEVDGVIMKDMIEINNWINNQ